MEWASWPGSTGLAPRWNLSGADAGLQVSVTHGKAQSSIPAGVPPLTPNPWEMMLPGSGTGLTFPQAFAKVLISFGCKIPTVVRGSGKT